MQKNLSLFQTLKAESEYKGVRKCWWIYGKPGIGKSYAVRAVYPNLYVKSSTKWWDGYTNQDVVLVDELDSDALKHYVKIWEEPYRDWETDRKSTRLNSSHITRSRMPSSA